MAACNAWLSIGSTLRVGSSRSSRRGAMEESTGQRETLFHPRRESIETSVDERLELESTGQLSEAVLHLAWFQAAHGGEERQILSPGESPVETPLLAGYESNRSPDIDLFGERMAGHHGFPTIWHDQRSHCLEQGRLSCTVRSKQRDHLSLLDRETHAVKGNGWRLPRPQTEAQQIVQPKSWSELLGKTATPESRHIFSS